MKDSSPSDTNPLNWYDVPLFFARPGKALYYVAVQTQDRPGALATVIGVLQRESFNLIHVSMSEIGDGYAVGHLYGEGNAPGISTALEERLRASGIVRNVRVEEGRDGLLIGRALPLRLRDPRLRATAITSQYLISTLDTLREEMGSGGATLVYRQGLDLGRNAWTRHAALLGGMENVRKHFGYLLEGLALTGYGRPTLLDIDPKEGTAHVRFSESIECMGRELSNPYSQFFRGYFAGTFSAVFDVEMSCVETKCSAVGAEACEFEITRKEAARAGAPS